MEDTGGGTSKLHHCQGLMHPMHMAPPDRKLFFRSDIHAFRIDDADSNANRTTQTLAYPRLY